jgi:hypothetical protein
MKMVPVRKNYGLIHPGAPLCWVRQPLTGSGNHQCNYNYNVTGIQQSCKAGVTLMKDGLAPWNCLEKTLNRKPHSMQVKRKRHPVTSTDLSNSTCFSASLLSGEMV